MAATKNSGTSRVYKTVKAAAQPEIGTIVKSSAVKQGQFFELTDSDRYSKAYSGPYMGRPYVCTQEATANTAIVGSNDQGYLIGFYEVAEVKLAKEFKLDLSKIKFTTRVSMTGCDPEIFLTKKDGSLIPAFNILPFQKDAKKPVNKSLILENGSVTSGQYGNYWTPHYADGFAAEFGITPGSCHGWGMDRVRFGLESIWQAAKHHDKEAQLTLQNVMAIDPEMLANASADQIALGCSPSKNAYGDEVQLPTDARTLPFRVAGGHLHFAMPAQPMPGTPTREQRNEISAKWMDFMVAIPAVAMFEGIDSPTRRRFYGRAGEYRDKPYGLEYRTLSNAWLGHPAVAHLTWNLARTGASVPDQGLMISDPASMLGFDEQVIKDIINNCDVDGARAFIKKHWEIYTNALTASYGGSGGGAVQKALKLFEVGVKQAIPGYENILPNWKIGVGFRWEAHTDNSRSTWTNSCNNFNL